MHGFKLVILVYLTTKCYSSKILGIMPTASYSHQIPFQPLWRELSLRGHQVTVLTTNPISDPHLTNLTEISLSFVYEFFEDVKFYQTLADDSLYFWERGVYLKDVSVRMAYLLLENEAVRSVFKEKFDLVIAEAHFPIVIGIAGNFRCPWIGISSMDPALHAHVALGNPSHPVLNPDPNLEVEDPDHPGFVERVLSFLYRNIYLFEFDKSLLPLLQRIHKDLVEDLLPLSEIQNNVSMLFVGTHPLFHNLRAVYPNTITLGCGMHFSQAKPLPKDLKKFLDGAKEGAIYFSLGSNVNSKSMSSDFKKAIVEAFAQIPYKVLLKMDDELEGTSENVLVQKWMPQQDILRHPNIKLFITQGGLQSLQEAVVNDIPLIGIPFLGDQITNVNKMVKRGYGIKVDKRTITKEALVAAINEVMNNPKYRMKAKEMGEIFRDEEIPSLQRAVYWTEYVIRHKGAKHLKSQAVEMPAWKYYMLDVIGFLAAIGLLVVFVCYLLVKFLFLSIVRLCGRSKKPKVKRN